MEVIYTPDALADRDFWKKSGNKAVMNKISSLIASIMETPESGIGKPERLKHNLADYWSRRIDREHRIVYRILDDHIEIFSMKGHYEPK